MNKQLTSLHIHCFQRDYKYGDHTYENCRYDYPSRQIQYDGSQNDNAAIECRYEYSQYDYAHMSIVQ